MRISPRWFWLASALLVTVVTGLLYVAVQQAFRQGANEPQASIARDAVKALNQGATPAEVTSGRRIDVAYDMAPFLIVYDKSGTVLAGKGYVEGEIPQLPIGVLHAASPTRANTVTWEPARGVRIASVSLEADAYYVLGGRSLAKVEATTAAFGKWLLGLWIGALVLILAAYKLHVRLPRELK